MSVLFIRMIIAQRQPQQLRFLPGTMPQLRAALSPALGNSLQRLEGMVMDQPALAGTLLLSGQPFAAHDGLTASLVQERG